MFVCAYFITKHINDMRVNAGARFGERSGKIFGRKFWEKGNVYIFRAAILQNMEPSKKNIDLLVGVLQGMKLVELTATACIIFGAVAYVFICGCPNLLVSGIVVRLACIPIRIYLVRAKRFMEASALIEA